MSAVATKSCCTTCEKEVTVVKCEDCWKTANGSQLAAESDAKVQQQRDLIQQVDDWECNAMHQIRQTAEEARQMILKHTTDRIGEMQEKLSKLNDQLRQFRQASSFIPKDISQMHGKLAHLTKQLVAPSKSSIVVQKMSSPLVTKVLVDTPALLSVPSIGVNAIWSQYGVSVAGGNGRGNGLNQFIYPLGLRVDEDQTIYVVDQLNHRVVEWKKGASSGRVLVGGNGEGNEANQLNYPSVVLLDKESDCLIIADSANQRVVRWPRQNGTSGETIISVVAPYGLAMDSHGHLYVSDCNRHEVKRWKMGETNGTVVVGGNGQGNRLDQLSSPYHIFVDQDRSVYVSDDGNHRVMKWVEGAKEGIVVAGGQGRGNSLTQLSNPRGVVVDQLGTVYVADYSNYRVVRWPKGATQGSVVVGGNGGGAQSDQFNTCYDLTFDQQGNLYVSDYQNHRVQKFNIDPTSNQ